MRQDSLTPMYRRLKMTAEHKKAAVSSIPLASWIAACIPFTKTGKNGRRRRKTASESVFEAKRPEVDAFSRTGKKS